MDQPTEPLRGTEAVNGELEVGFDARFEAAWSRLERIGRWSMLVIVIAGLLGFFGAGPLDHRSAVSHEITGFSVDYQPIGRFGTATQVTIHIPAASGERVVDLHLSSTFFEPLGAGTLAPRPTREIAEGGGMVVELPVAAGAALLRIAAKPSKVGIVPLSVSMGDDTKPLHFAELVLP